MVYQVYQVYHQSTGTKIIQSYRELEFFGWATYLNAAQNLLW